MGALRRAGSAASWLWDVWGASFAIGVSAAGEIVVGQVAPLSGVLSEAGKEMVLGARGGRHSQSTRRDEHDANRRQYQDDPFGKAGLAGVEAVLKKRNLDLVATGAYEKTQRCRHSRRDCQGQSASGGDDFCRQEHGGLQQTDSQGLYRRPTAQHLRRQSEGYRSPDRTGGRAWSGHRASYALSILSDHIDRQGALSS